MREVYVVVSYDILHLQTVECVCESRECAEKMKTKIDDAGDCAYVCIYPTKLVKEAK
jgi:hypothetical protein